MVLVISLCVITVSLLYGFCIFCRLLAYWDFIFALSIYSFQFWYNIVYNTYLSPSIKFIQITCMALLCNLSINSPEIISFLVIHLKIHQVMLFIWSKLDSFKTVFWAPFKDLKIHSSKKSLIIHRSKKSKSPLTFVSRKKRQVKYWSRMLQNLRIP